MVPLVITLDPSSAYAAGDTLSVALDGAVIAPGIDLHPGGGDFPGMEIVTAPVGYGAHTVTVTTRDALGNESEPIPTVINVDTGPRPPSALRFASQVDDGPIAFAFAASPDAPAGITGYELFRAASLGAIDFDTPCGTAAANATTITEDDDDRAVTDGTMVYAVRAVNAGDFHDEADPAVNVEVELASGEVQLPPPKRVKLWAAVPIAGGKVLIQAYINNVGVTTPVAELRIYLDEDEPVYTAPHATEAVPTSGAFTHTFVVDPAFPNATVVGIGLRAASADGVEESNSDFVTVTVDSAPPADFEGVTVEPQA